MRFNYADEPTISEAITQAIGYGSVCWSDVAGAGEFDSGRASVAADAAIAEVRHIVTFELSKLLDPVNVAEEWNNAIEQAIRTVEDLA